MTEQRSALKGQPLYYCIRGRDAPDALALRLANRAEHLARLRALHEQLRIVIAGPLPAIDAVDPGKAGFTGSVIIAKFDSLEDARAWAGEDPYLEAGAWASVEVEPFVQVLP
jgi:uncharacterized protein YciI